MTMSYDIRNPTKARRIIYDGSKDQKEVVIEPGDTKKAVPLADHIVKGLRAKKEPDLELTEAEQQEKQTLTLPTKK